jgi:hypothetical protein
MVSIKTKWFNVLDTQEEKRREPNSNKIYNIVALPVLTFAITLKIWQNSLNLKKFIKFFSAIWEYMNIRDMSLKELIIFLSIIEDWEKNCKLTSGLKKEIKNLKSEINIKVKSLQNEEEMKEDLNIENEMEQIDQLWDEAQDRLKIFTDFMSDIEINKLSTPKPIFAERKPRFTDICQINNDSEENVVDEVSNQYMMVDNESMYSQVYSDYVKKSINASPISKLLSLISRRNPNEPQSIAKTQQSSKENFSEDNSRRGISS